MVQEHWNMKEYLQNIINNTYCALVGMNKKL